MDKIIVRLGIDSAMYEDEKTINLGAYATEIGKRLRAQFSEYKFAVSAFEDDNAETELQFPDSISEREKDFIVGFIIGAEGVVYSDPDMWNS